MTEVTHTHNKQISIYTEKICSHAVTAKAQIVNAQNTQPLRLRVIIIVTLVITIVISPRRWRSDVKQERISLLEVIIVIVPPRQHSLVHHHQHRLEMEAAVVVGRTVIAVNSKNRRFGVGDGNTSDVIIISVNNFITCIDRLSLSTSLSLSLSAGDGGGAAVNPGSSQSSTSSSTKEFCSPS